jgi:hypothetical protein
MPTFLIGGFKMRFYSNDHEPAHVHCINGDGVVIVNVGTGEVAEIRGRVKTPDVAKAARLVHANRDRLLVEWNLFYMRKAIR